jgi:hypothetical protein
MATWIKLQNNAAGPIAIVDGNDGGAAGVVVNALSDPHWIIKAGGQAILGPGATNIGPGTFDWIWDTGNSTIVRQRAGTYDPTLLITLPTPHVGDYVITVTYNGDGTLTAALDS